MIIVTGAGGNVGRQLVGRLKEAGAPLRACFNSPRKAAEARAAGIDAAVLDYAKPETLDPALAGGEKLFLLSPPERTELEPGVVEAARRAGIRKIVKLSVWGTPSEAFSFARAHRAIERKIEKSGIPFTFLRPNGFMQNFVAAHASTIKNQDAFYAPARDSRISFIDVRDIAAVAARVLVDAGHDGKAYGLSGPEAPTHAEIAEKFSRALGKPVRYVDLPDDDYVRALEGFGLSNVYARAILDLHHYYRNGAASAVTPDVERITGRKPISFQQFIQDHAASFAGAETRMSRN